MDKKDFFFNCIQQKLSELPFQKSPVELYQPMSYSLTLGGKRIRPILTLMSCEMFGMAYEKAIPAALAFEIFHNFTLVHDDLMDLSPLRRGNTTVYKKWDSNIAILSGDALYAKAFEILAESNESTIKPLVSLLSKTAIEVCEGQQLDMNFEKQDHISIGDYLEMITLKTSVLLGAALKAGAIVAGAHESDVANIYEFGKYLGLAFQIQDDMLDIYGEEEKFGKINGNDIITRKKTFLFLSACNQSDSSKLEAIKNIFYSTTLSDADRVLKVTAIYEELKIKDIVRNKMIEYHSQSLDFLKKTSVSEENKKELYQLAESLLYRDK
jgi:geranylgeranyl diphosphate synthase type II